MPSFTDMNVFNHRGGKSNPAFGEIATARWEADATLSIDGKPVPQASIVYLLAYGIRQTLQDSYASAESAEDAKAKYAAKLESIMDGTVGSRAGSGGVSDETLAGRNVIRRLIKAGRNPELAKEYKAASDAKERNEILDARIAANADNAAFTKAVKAEVAAMVAERKRVAETASNLGDDIEL